MKRYGSTRTVGIAFLMMFSLSAMAVAQGRSTADLEKDLRLQPYLYASYGAFPSGAGGTGTYGAGFGTDYLVYEGLGVGAEVTAFGNNAFGFGVASFNASYHFTGLIRRSSRLVPFIKAGIGSGGEFGYGGVAMVNFGGGVNLWKLDGAAVRLELVDRFPLDGGDHHVSIQMGITF